MVNYKRNEFLWVLYMSLINPVFTSFIDKIPSIFMNELITKYNIQDRFDPEQVKTCGM